MFGEDYFKPNYSLSYPPQKPFQVISRSQTQFAPQVAAVRFNGAGAGGHQRGYFLIAQAGFYEGVSSTGVHASYVWNDGETTDSILVLQPYYKTDTVRTIVAGCSDTSYITIARFDTALTSFTYSCTDMVDTVDFSADSGINRSTVLPISFVFTNYYNTADTIHNVTVDTTSNPYVFTFIFPKSLLPDTNRIAVYSYAANGCFAVNQFILSVDSFPVCHPYDLCFSDSEANVITYLSDTVLSDTLTVPTGSDIYFGPNTVLLVNSPKLTFENCEIVMGGGSEIIVDAGDTLNILGSTFKGCDTMWTGIFVYDSASINVDEYDSTRSIIEDAVDGITIVGKKARREMLINHTDFYKNEYSVVLYDYFPAGNNSYDISDCYFGMGAFTQLLPVPHGDSITKRPISGIVVEWDVPFIIVPSGFDTISIPNPHLSGLPNTFQYMNTGIYAINSVLNVYTNTFDSIRNFEHPNPWGFYGAAIVGSPNFAGIGTSNYLWVQTASSSPDSLSTIYFKDCDYGIKAQSFDLTTLNNRMENVTYGVYSTNTNNRVTVNSNYIHNTNYGVSLVNNSSATQIVEADTIYVNPPIEQLTPYAIRPLNFHGILISDTLYFKTSLQTYGIEETEVTGSNTAIEGNVVWNGLNCIVLNNAKGTQVKFNTLHQKDTLIVYTQQAGLYAANCTGIYVSANLCDADSNYYAGVPTRL